MTVRKKVRAAVCPLRLAGVVRRLYRKREPKKSPRAILWRWRPSVAIISVAAQVSSDPDHRDARYQPLAPPPPNSAGERGGPRSGTVAVYWSVQVAPPSLVLMILPAPAPVATTHAAT